MTTVSLSEAKDNLSSLIKKAGKKDIIITVHGRAAGVLHGFENEEDYLEYRLLNDPRFKKMIKRSREEAKKGQVTHIDDL
jgi:prevent-host-death family protein